MTNNNQTIDPLTYQADLGHRVLSRLIGRQGESSARQPASVAEVERDATSLTVRVVAADGTRSVPPAGTPVTIFVEPRNGAPGSLAAPRVVEKSVDEYGRVELEPKDAGQIIAALIIRHGSINAVAGRIDPPADTEARYAAPQSPPRRPPTKKGSSSPRGSKQPDSRVQTAGDDSPPPSESEQGD